MTTPNAEVKTRREVADAIFRYHSDVNRAVGAAVEEIMQGAEVRPAVHLMETAIDLAARDMRKAILL